MFSTTSVFSLTGEKRGSYFGERKGEQDQERWMRQHSAGGSCQFGYLPRNNESPHLNVVIRDEVTGVSMSWTEWIERADVTMGER